MKITPHLCPKCGSAATGTAERVPGIALLTFDDHGNAEYTGETKLNWDGQTTERDDQERVVLLCPEFHYWLAEMEHDDDDLEN